jgi:DNA-binding CsgD family transcriptional regulator/tetratricopeptide (TPR) repeat protein
VLDRKVSDLTTELRSAVESGILISDQDRLTFRHELVREAIYLDIPEAVRRALHLEAARALARAGAPADEVAYHYAQGAERGDHDAADWITEAARRAAPLSPDAATRLYRRALELIHDHQERKQVLAELAETLLWSGRLAEAGIVAEEALDTASPSAVSRRLRGSLARASLMQGQVGAAREHLRAASMSAGTEGDERGRFESEEALISLFSGDLAGAIEKATALRATAESLGDDRLRCETLVVLGLAAFFSARVHEGVELLRESLDPSIRRPDVLRWAPHVFLGTALIELDALKDAEKVLIEGLRFSERMGMGWPSGFYRTQIGLQHFVGGRWVLAAEELSLAVSDPLSNPGLTVFPRAMLATMAVHRGDVDDARAHLKAAGEAAGSGSSFGIDVMMWGQSMLLNATSGPSDGRQVLESAWQINESLGFISQCIRIGPDLVRLAIATDDRALARSVSEVMRDAAARNPVASWRGAALLCRGLGDDDTDVLARSIAVYRTSPRPVEFAFACLDVAAVFIRTGTDGAAEIVHEALEVLEPLNLRPHVARADSLLRSLGIKRGRRDRRGRPAEGWESLTETEFAVVELAAEGLTNPEIGRRLYISRRTVESHLSHAFAKLGLSSRVQLAAEAARRGMRSPPVPDER